MCKRKIKTVKVLLSLLLFAAVMFQIPSDVHAQVETMTTKPALCSKAVSYSSAAKASAAKKATATFRSSKTTLWVGHKVTMRSLITLKGGTSLSIKAQNPADHLFWQFPEAIWSQKKQELPLSPQN